MATIYSLACWGGKDGKSVTGDAATDRFTLTNHGLINGTGLYFSAGTMPTQGGTPVFNLITAYYARAFSLNEFSLHPTQADALAGTNQIVFDNAGSGLIMKSQAYVEAATYFSFAGLSDKTRWTYGGTEYIYDGIASWLTGRAGASSLDVEVCELGMAFIEYTGVQINVALPAASTIIASTVAGVRSGAYHGGSVTGGFELNATANIGTLLSLNSTYTTIDGFALSVASGKIVTNLTLLNEFSQTVKNMRIIGHAGASTIGTSSSGITLSKQGPTVINNRVHGCLYGISVPQYLTGVLVANNVVTKCGTGMRPTLSTNISGNFYNNISVGNTTNWGTATGFTNASRNAGLSGEAWVTGLFDRVTIATTDFANYPTDMSPALVTSPQVETGTDYYGALLTDIADTVRPAYPGSAYGTAVTAGSFVAGLSYTIASVGTTDFTLIGAASNTVGVTFKATGVGSGTGTATLNAKLDVGAYEFDLGYGSWPTTDYYGLAYTLLSAGSKLKVFATGTDTERFSTASSGTSETWSVNSSGTDTVDYSIMKAGFVPIRVAGISVTGGPDGIQSVPVDQVEDRGYSASSGLTIGVDTFATVGTKLFGLIKSSTTKNFYSYLVEQWIALGDTGEAYANKDFPMESTGPNSFTARNGWKFDLTTYPNSISYLSRGGLRYLNPSENITDLWAAFLTTGVPGTLTVRYKHASTGAWSSAASAGNMDQLVKLIEDPNGDGVYTDGFNRTGTMIVRVQGEGHDMAEVDVVGTFGTLDNYLYSIAPVPTANGIATGNPTLNGSPAITVGTFVQGGKTFSIKIVDGVGGNSATDLMRWVRYAQGQGGTFQGREANDWHDLIRVNGNAFKTVRGTIYGPTATAGVIVYQSDGTTLHSGFNLFTADDGTTYSPPVTASVAITGMPDAVGAYNRLQIINKTAAVAAAWQASTAYTLGDVRLRSSGVGTENTAGLYMRCTSAGTSGGTEPTWNTTVGGTTVDNGVTWTTYAVLFYDADPASTGYSTSYTNGNEFTTGESVEIRFAEMNAGTSFKTFSTTTIASSSGIAVDVAEEVDDVFATNALDGSAFETTYSPNFIANYIVLDTNTDFSGKSTYAYFCYTLTGSQGMYRFWRGVTAIDPGNYRIETDVLNLFFDESAGFVKQTDSVRIFRKDGLRPALDPTTGGFGIEMNWRTPVSVVSTGGSALTAEESAKLLSLVNAPSAAQNATETLAAAASAGGIHADMKKTNGVALKGDGTEADKFRSTLVP